MNPIDGERTPKADRYAKQLPEPIPAGSGRSGGGCPLGSTALMIIFVAASLPPVRLAVRAARDTRPGVTIACRRDNGRGRHAHLPVQRDGCPLARAAAATHEKRG